MFDKISDAANLLANVAAQNWPLTISALAFPVGIGMTLAVTNPQPMEELAVIMNAPKSESHMESVSESWTAAPTEVVPEAVFEQEPLEQLDELNQQATAVVGEAQGTIDEIKMTAAASQASSIEQAQTTLDQAQVDLAQAQVRIADLKSHAAEKIKKVKNKRKKKSSEDDYAKEPEITLARRHFEEALSKVKQGLDQVESGKGQLKSERLARARQSLQKVQDLLAGRQQNSGIIQPPAGAIVQPQQPIAPTGPTVTDYYEAIGLTDPH